MRRWRMMPADRGSVGTRLLVLVACLALAFAPSLAAALHAPAHGQDCCASTGASPASQDQPKPEHDRDDCPICISLAGLGGLTLRLLDGGSTLVDPIVAPFFVLESPAKGACAHAGGTSARGPPARA